MAISKREGIDPITEHHYENLKFGKNKGNKTVFTLQVEHPKLNKGKPTLIPSIWDGKELSEDAAIKKAIDSKIKWTAADDHKELRKYDMLLHDPKKMNMDLDNTGDQKSFAEGGTTMQNQMSMFEDGGMMDQGGTQDPVSGNAVPVGSLQEEVRDDVDAKLSPGEYVVPADVVRYFGLDFFMQLRDKAKTGLARMESIGQMGNSESTTNPTDTLFSQNEDMDVPFSKDDLEIYKEDNDEDEKLSAQVGAYVPTKQAPQTNTLDSYLARVGDKPAMYDGGLVDTSLKNRGISYPTGSVKRFVDTTDAKRSDLFITVDANNNPTTQIPSGYAPADSFPSSSSSADPFKGGISTLGATELDRPSGPDDNKIEAFNYAPPNEGGDLTQEQWDNYFAGKSAGERAKTAFGMAVKGIPGQGGGFSQLADMFGPVIPPMSIAGALIQGLSGRGAVGKLVDVFRDKEEPYRIDPETGEPYADFRVESSEYSKETPTYAPDIPSPKEQRGVVDDPTSSGDTSDDPMDFGDIPTMDTTDFDLPDYTSGEIDFDYDSGGNYGNQDYKTGGFIKRKYAPGGLVDSSLASRRTSLIDKSLSEKGINTASNPKDTSVESEPPAEQSLLDPSTTPYKNTGITYSQKYAPKLIARSGQTGQLKDPSLSYILRKYADPEDFEHVLQDYSSRPRIKPGTVPLLPDDLTKELDDLFGQRLSIIKPINHKTNPEYLGAQGRALPGFTAEEFKQKYGPDVTIGDAYRKMLAKEYSVLDDMQSGGGELPNQFGSFTPFLNLVMRGGEKSNNYIKNRTQKLINRAIDPNKKIETAQDATDVTKLVYWIGSGGNRFPLPGEGEPFSVWSKMPTMESRLTAYKNANLIPQSALKTANVGAFVTKPSKKKTSVKKRGLASKK